MQTYRTGDDYHRYSFENADRVRAMTSLYATYKRYIGHRVLDLCCGGGALGKVLEAHGRDYIGIDANPDMIREARKGAAEAGSSLRFVLGDVGRVRIAGRFDTVTLVGNSLAHIAVRDLDELLRRRRTNVHPGSTFLLDYRDLIGMFWQGTWGRKKVQTFVRGRVVHTATLVDLEHGRLSNAGPAVKSRVGARLVACNLVTVRYRGGNAEPRVEARETNSAQAAQRGGHDP